MRSNTSSCPYHVHPRRRFSSRETPLFERRSQQVTKLHWECVWLSSTRSINKTSSQSRICQHACQRALGEFLGKHLRLVDWVGRGGFSYVVRDLYLTPAK